MIRVMRCDLLDHHEHTQRDQASTFNFSEWRACHVSLLSPKGATQHAHPYITCDYLCKICATFMNLDGLNGILHLFREVFKRKKLSHFARSFHTMQTRAKRRSATEKVETVDETRPAAAASESPSKKKKQRSVKARKEGSHHAGGSEHGALVERGLIYFFYRPKVEVWFFL